MASSTSIHHRKTLALVALVLLPLSAVLRSSPSRVPSAPRHAAGTVVVGSKEPAPFATLLNHNVGETLTGSYTLGADHLLQTRDASTSGGSIEFPPLDLSSVLAEEAADPENRPRMIFGQAVLNSDLLRKGSTPDLLVDSFLGPASKFASVVAAGSDLGIPLADDRALLTRRGYKPGNGPNQDAVLLAHFVLDVDGPPGPGDARALLLGIFDGHGPRGHAVSQWCALELPRTFAKIMRQAQGSLPRPLLESLRSPDPDPRVVAYIQQSLSAAFLEVDAREPVKGTSGSTASTLFYPGRGSKVYVANAGDSTTLVVAYSKATQEARIAFRNTQHKPHLPEERRRIENAGGSVLIPPSLLQAGNASESGDEPKETSRLVIPDASGGPFGGLALAMSRSIGDFDGKAVGLIADPDVTPWDVHEYYAQHNFSPGQIEDTTWFAIVASDGVYDVLKPRLVVGYLGAALHGRGAVSPLEACERLVREASRLWMKSSLAFGAQPYRDDISIGVSKIHFSST